MALRSLGPEFFTVCNETFSDVDITVVGVIFLFLKIRLHLEFTLICLQLW